ncbi:transposase [Brachybacterium sp. GCM10030268]|uniref:transposase n=1 Tax=Brachybacterium sp. GCM10030268 TaxID=3273382 RepID=UPI003619A98A
MHGSQSTWHRVGGKLTGPPEVGADTSNRPRNSRQLPVVVASGPGQAWSWDITELKSTYSRITFKMYSVIDIFSRYRIASRVEIDSAGCHAVEMFTEAIAREGAPRVIHSDNGGAMKSTALMNLFDERGIGASNSRPYVSNDNPYSEAEFSTMKSRSSYPEYFESLQNAREFDHAYTVWANNQQYHSGVAHFTPSQVHFGTWRTVWARREATLQRYYESHPERFRAKPKTPSPPATVGINHLVQTA